MKYTDGSPDTPIVTNEQGGKQSHTNRRFDLIDPHAHMLLARIFDYGAKRYEPDNWRKISVMDHLNHAELHMTLYRAGDRQDDHLGHAMWRLHAAVACAIAEGYDCRQSDEKNDIDNKSVRYLGSKTVQPGYVIESSGFFHPYKKE